MTHLVCVPGKFPVDARFLLTAAATFVLIVAVVALLNVALGLPAASVGAAVLGAVAVKLFDKLDYTPSFVVEFGAPRISAPWVYSALAAILMVYGCWVFADFMELLLRRELGPGPLCTLWPIVGVSLFDWGGFVLAGWLVGRLFPGRALTLSSIGAFVFVATHLLERHTPEDFAKLEACLGSGSSPGEDQSTWAVVFPLAMVARGYVVIFVARLAARKHPAVSS